MSNTYLVIGGDGLLGRSLTDSWRAQGARVIATTRKPAQAGPDAPLLDLETYSGGWQIPKDCKTAVLCAAVTSQEFCRRNPEASRRVNVDQTLRLATDLRAAGCFVVFLSTSLVFDGSHPMARADEPVLPKVEYGRQKAEVEAALLKAGNAAVVRLTKVFTGDLAVVTSWTKNLFVGKVIQPFSNYFCSPISLEHSVTALKSIAEKREGGIWQVSAAEDITYSAIAQRLAKAIGNSPGLVDPTTADAAQMEHMARYTTLEASRLEQAFGLKPPAALTAVDLAFAPFAHA